MQENSSNYVQVYVSSYCCCNKYHKLGCFKQHKLILLQFWGPEVSLADIQVIGRAVFILDAPGRTCPWPFPASGGSLRSSVHGPLPPSKPDVHHTASVPIGTSPSLLLLSLPQKSD